MTQMEIGKNEPLNYWKKLFQDDIHTYMPVLETVIELEEKLKETLFYLQTIDSATASQGIIIAKIGLTYAAKFLEMHFHMDDSFPEFTNLDQAILYLKNTIAQVGRINAEYRYCKSLENSMPQEPVTHNEETVPVESGNTEEQAIKRISQLETHTIQTTQGVILLDDLTKCITFKTNTIHFPSEKNYRLFALLCKNHNQPLDHKTILKFVWDIEDKGQPIDPTDKDTLTRTKCNLCKFLKNKSLNWIKIVSEYKGTYQIKFDGGDA